MNQKTKDEALYMKAACILCRMAERAGGILLGLAAWQVFHGVTWWPVLALLALALAGVVVLLDERIRERADAMLWGDV